MSKILVAEDDETVSFALVEALESASHTVEAVESGREAQDRLRLYQYDMAIIDWGLPQVSGPDICKCFRESGGSMPILMLTARSKENEKMEGLDAGADDYLTKPFSLGELLARVRALLRRPGNFVSPALQVRDLVLDSNLCKVFRDKQEIALLPQEYALLEFFMRNKNVVFDVNGILDRVWSSESEASEFAVRQCLMRLRKKIDSPGDDSIIKTIKGIGYVLEDKV